MIQVTHPTRLPRHALTTALVAALLLPASGLAASVMRTLDAGIGTDDNILSARDGLPHQVEQNLQLGATVALNQPLASGLSLRLQARVDGRLHARYEGLNALDAGADGQLLLRPGSGFYTPTLGVSMGIGTSQFQSRLRDAKEARLRVLVREPLSTRVLARAAAFTLWRGSDGQVFDTTIHGAEAALDWQAAPLLTLMLGYQYRGGKVASTGTPSPLLLGNAAAAQADDAFAGLTAVSFAAQTHTGFIGVSYALSPTLSVDTQLRYVESDPHFDARYHRWLSLTGLVARF